MGTTSVPLICSHLRSVGNLEAPYLDLVFEVGSGLWVRPLTCEVCAPPGSVRIDLNCKIPSWCPQRIGELLGMENQYLWCLKYCE